MSCVQRQRSCTLIFLARSLTAACHARYVCLGDGDAVLRTVEPCKFW